jgi:hypothetical protein
MSRSSFLLSLKPGIDQRDDLEPEAAFDDAFETPKHAMQGPAELSIVRFAEALEVDLVEIADRAQPVEHFGRCVAVADEAGLEPVLLGALEDRRAPFDGDERLVVGADHDGHLALEREAHDVVPRHGPEPLRSVRVAQDLRRIPVLAVVAVQVAAEHAEGQRLRPGSTW